MINTHRPNRMTVKGLHQLDRRTGRESTRPVIYENRDLGAN